MFLKLAGFPLLLCFCLISNANGVSLERGGKNVEMYSSQPENEEETDELAYPYFNVYYHFDPRDWNRILADHSKIMNLRKKVTLLRRQMAIDMNRANYFVDLQDNLLNYAKTRLFQRELRQQTKSTSNTKTHAHNGTTKAGDKEGSYDIHGIGERPESENAGLDGYIPTSELIDTNEPYYYQLLAEQFN